MTKQSKGRIPHRLKAGRRTEAPNRFLFFDTETLPRKVDEKTDELVFRLGEACFWERKRPGHPERERYFPLRSDDALWLLIDDLSEPSQSICVVAHNTAFDIQVCGGLSRLASHGWEITSAIIDDPPFILKARRQNSSLLFLDWYNYFRGSLAFAGELLGVPKMQMPAFSASNEEWAVYCRNDVRVLVEAMRRYVAFLHTYDLGTFAHTLAGQSLNAFRHRFMAHDIFIHTRKDAVDVEREGYYGGRVEMYRRNKLPAQTYTYVDINSAYPAVMRDGTYPTAFEGIETNVTRERVRSLLSDKLLMAQVVVRTKQPLFPLRTEGRLIFPVGEFATALATPELRMALDRGLLVSIDRLTIYKGEPIFRTFVDEMYELRKDAKIKKDELWNELLKRMMNSLFGKFGQHNYEWTDLLVQEGKPDGIWRELDKDTMRVRTFRRLGGILSERSNKSEGYNSFVAIAAHVTSASRILLLRYIEAAGWDHTYYCDTDSLIVDETGIANLAPYLDPSELGKLKVERTATDVRLLAPKNYTFGDIVKHKGRKTNATKLSDGRYEQEQFVSLVGALRIGWNGGPLIRRVTKKDRLTYKKGVVSDDGRVTPFHLFRP